MSIVVKFSPPPSANNLWKPIVTKTGKPALVKTKHYHCWIGAAAWEVKVCMGHRPALAGNVRLSIKVPRKSKLSDSDNRVKASFDALQAGGALKNDRQIIGYTFEWLPPEADSVEIELYEVAA